MATPYWTLTGNAGTNSGVDFLGTQDGQALIIKTAGTERIRVNPTGKVGIGIMDPAGQLSLGNYNGIRQLVWDGDLNNTTGANCGFGISLASAVNTFDIFLGQATFALNIVAPTGPWPYPGYSVLMTVLNNGNVGVGTSAPATKLHVAGDVTVTGDVLLTGADCAEHFDLGEGRQLDPGTVVIIAQGGRLCESREPYDKTVGGVVSGAGSLRPALILDSHRQEGRRHVAIALTGKVYCKVDAQYSQIKVGDLLTTSPTPGHAMKAAELSRAFGAVIGKALESLEQGRGLIPILVALQ